MKKKLSAKAIISLVLSLMLFCLPIGAFVANEGNAVSVHAQDTEVEEKESSKENTEMGTDKDTEESTVSGNDIPKPECSCTEKCTQYSVNKQCDL